MVYILHLTKLIIFYIVSFFYKLFYLILLSTIYDI